MVSLVEDCGIDVVDKAALEVRLAGRSIGRFHNTPSGMKDLMKRVPKGTSVHLESMDGYDRLCRRTLVKAGYSVRLHNPYRVQKASQGLGVTPCKTISKMPRTSFVRE